MNPHFVGLCKFLTAEEPALRLGVTTNGLFSDAMAEELAQHLDFVTLSYHCEAEEKQKQRIHSTIEILNARAKDSSIRLSDFNINLMVHAEQEYFEECVQLSKKWSDLGIRFERRAIGEHPNAKGAHRYSPEQIEFISGKRPPSTCGQSCSKTKFDLGRKCCGGRPFKEILGGEKLNSFDLQKISQTPNAERLNNRNFKGWSCLVNLFFLHIEQEMGQIFYHQTCQANHQGERGPIGTIDRIDDLIDEIGVMFSTKKVKAMICPNEVCNCGLCITKAEDPQILKNFLKSSMPGFELWEGESVS